MVPDPVIQPVSPERQSSWAAPNYHFKEHTKINNINIIIKRSMEQTATDITGPNFPVVISKPGIPWDPSGARCTRGVLSVANSQPPKSVSTRKRWPTSGVLSGTGGTVRCWLKGKIMENLDENGSAFIEDTMWPPLVVNCFLYLLWWL